ncbi:DUF5723 family protein [Winogradskyella ursingii]|uniref:DUF5723 family protein n=1 Tax=Winogradskyella ursingii TaxID=2686079 RepID=UPI0015C7472A|nr:DUF5723 family protein [Winogradskyella ursingii]
MKRHTLYTLALFLALTLSSFSQNKQLLFGFTDIPQSVLINPSTQLENDWFVGFPLLSQLHANVGLSGVSAFDLFADDGKDFNSKLQDVVFRMEATDFYTATQQVEIFSGGFSKGSSFERDSYFSFGIYLESDVIVYHPKDYLVLAYEGNANNIGRPFDIGDLNVSAEMLSVFHFGFSKKVNEKLTLGARAKIYSSIFNVNSTNNRGVFITEEGENNLLKHTFILDLNVSTSGLKSLLNDENTNATNDTQELVKRVLLGGNLGLGLDVGMTYQVSDQVQFEASLQDFGFINHTKDLETYDIKGNFVFDGINPVFPEVGDGQTAEEYYEEISENFEELFDTEAEAEKYTTLRPIKFNTALRYAFGKNRSRDCNCLADDDGYINAVGVQLYAINRPKAPQMALTAFYYRRILRGLRAKVTYTMDSFSYTNVGLGMSAHLGPLNFYILADNLLEYQNLAKAQSASLQLGLNLVFGRGQ